MESLFGSLPEMLDFQRVFLQTLEEKTSSSPDFMTLQTAEQLKVTECTNQAHKPVPLCYNLFFFIVFNFFRLFCKLRNCFPHWVDPFCTTQTTLSSTVASAQTISKSRKFSNEVCISSEHPLCRMVSITPTRVEK